MRFIAVAVSWFGFEVTNNPNIFRGGLSARREAYEWMFSRASFSTSEMAMGG
jgi:hypothetical protein